MPTRGKTVLSMGIAVVFFVIPVSVGMAVSEPERWPIDQPPIDFAAPIPASGVVRFSTLEGHRSHWRSCTDYEVTLTPEQRAMPRIRRALIEGLAPPFDPASASCAERFPYAPKARCTTRWSRMPMSGPESGLIEVRYVEREHRYLVDEGDEERCRGEWEVLP